jgi:hypothetical protein
LYHHVTTPKGRARASPFLIARTFSSASGRTIPAIPLPIEKEKSMKVSAYLLLHVQ